MDIKVNSKPNLTTLRSKNEKKKSGRKRPRPNDFDYVAYENEKSATVMIEDGEEGEVVVTFPDTSISGPVWTGLDKSSGDSSQRRRKAHSFIAYRVAE